MNEWWKSRRLLTLALGYMSWGLGQRLLRVAFLGSVLEGRGFPYLLIGIGLLSLIVGIVLLLRIGLWFIRTYGRQEVVRVLAYGLLASVSSGWLLGLLGQGLYDHTSWDYMKIKTSIWVLSTLIQTVIKFAVLYGLSCLYHHRPYRWKEKMPLSLLGVGLLITVVGISLTLFLPASEGFCLYVTDYLAVIGAAYYLQKQ